MNPTVYVFTRQKTAYRSDIPVITGIFTIDRLDLLEQAFDDALDQEYYNCGVYITKLNLIRDLYVNEPDLKIRFLPLTEEGGEILHGKVEISPVVGQIIENVGNQTELISTAINARTLLKLDDYE